MPISSHIVYHYGNDSSLKPRRDLIKSLRDLDHKYLAFTKWLFYIPSGQFFKIDDELIGTWSKENSVNSIAAQKADREGHISDIV